MQIVKSQKNIVEKVFRDKEGRLVRATFCVYENAGRIKARLVDFVYITAGEISGKILSLTISMSKGIFDTRFLSNFQLSTFNFSLLSIFSLGSKPRAPALQ